MKCEVLTAVTMKNTDFLAVTGNSLAEIYLCFRELAVSTFNVEESAVIDKSV
jgi:hypothetical protein